MLNSFGKSLWISLAFIVVLSACGAPVGSESSDRSSSYGTTGESSLKVPSVEILIENDNINLSWSDANAAQYRVLYWQGNNAPQDFITTSTDYTLPPLGSGDYTIIVEAYDALGNSLFSAPIALEVV